MDISDTLKINFFIIYKKIEMTHYFNDNKTFSYPNNGIAKIAEQTKPMVE